MSRLRVDGSVIDEPIKDIVYRLRDTLGGKKLREIQDKGSELVVTCPNRDHSDGCEKTPDCHISLIDRNGVPAGTFNCFACGASGSFVRFVALCFDSPMDYAKRWLIANYGKLDDSPTLELEPIELEPKAGESFLDESILDAFQSYHPYMDKRRLSKKVCEAFKVRYDPKSECIVFPVWDDRGRLVMLTRRSVNSKMFLIDKDKEKPVYLMNFIKERDLREVTICESQINALTLMGWGIPAVATFGCNVTQKQLDIINRSGVSHVYVCYDGDQAGRKGTKKLLAGLCEGILADVVDMPPGKDVNDLTEEEFDRLRIVEGQEWLNENKD